MAHVHNVVALGIWIVAVRRAPSNGRSHLWVLGLFTAAAVSFFVLPVDAITTFRGVTLGAQMRALAPVDEPLLGQRIVLFFAFAQSVHYAVWLRAVPDDARHRSGIRGFRSTVRALCDEFGVLIFVGFALLAIGIAAWSLFDVPAARTGYLRIAISHGYLEIATCLLLALEARYVDRSASANAHSYTFSAP